VRGLQSALPSFGFGANRPLIGSRPRRGSKQERALEPSSGPYRRKQGEGKSRKEALRALKRRISDAAYRQLLADAQR
jgi:hypothetical protein